MTKRAVRKQVDKLTNLVSKVIDYNDEKLDGTAERISVLIVVGATQVRKVEGKETTTFNILTAASHHLGNICETPEFTSLKYFFGHHHHNAKYVVPPKPKRLGNWKRSLSQLRTLMKELCVYTWPKSKCPLLPHTVM